MAQGKFGGGNGAPETPYLIEDADDLSAIRFTPGLSYKLVNSINLGVAPYNTGKGWMPIRDFTGTLDGNGKKIFNLFICRPAQDNVGLFEQIRQVDGGALRICNLGIEDADITGKNNVGAIAGSMGMLQTTGAVQTTFLFERCYVTGKVLAESQGGGLVGYIFWSSTSMSAIFNLAQDCLIDVTLKPAASSQAFGAICGSFDNSAVKNFVINYVLSASTFIAAINGLPASLSPKSLGTGNGVANWAAGSGNCFYDSTHWPFSASPSSVGKTTNEMTKTRFADIDNRTLSDETLIWDYEEGVRYPMLRQFFLDRFFVRTRQGYCVYEGGSWVIKYTTMPTRAQAIKTGMKHLSSIPYSAWDTLRQTETMVDIINVLEVSNGTTQSSSVYSMALDNAVSIADKNYFRKEVKFSNFGHNIVTINKGVVA
jgi:hypothetical protein